MQYKKSPWKIVFFEIVSMIKEKKTLVFYFFFLITMIVELLLWIFITLYGLTGLATFGAHIPKVMNSDDEFVKGNVRDYLFRLLTSVIFFLYAIFVMDNPLFSLLFTIELIVFIGVFAWLVYKKKRYVADRVKKLISSKRKFF